MTFSPDRDHKIEPMPPTLSSMWRLCKLGYQHERRLMLGALVLSQLAAFPMSCTVRGSSRRSDAGATT